MAGRDRTSHKSNHKALNVRKYPEDEMWRWVKASISKHAKGLIRFERIENRVSNNIPDVHFTTKLRTGWFENKVCYDRVYSDNQKVHIPHFTAGQKTWLYRQWQMMGDNCSSFLLLKITDYLLLVSPDVAYNIEEYTFGELKQKAILALPDDSIDSGQGTVLLYRVLAGAKIDLSRPLHDQLAERI